MKAVAKTKEIHISVSVPTEESFPTYNLRVVLGTYQQSRFSILKHDQLHGLVIPPNA